MKITLVQANLHWEDKTRNLAAFSKPLEQIAETDLIILPEMFTTGFSMRSKDLAETMGGDTIQWMKIKSAEKKAIVTGSFICEENGKYYNRLVWMQPDGTFATYDKRHLFRMGNEEQHYHAGDKRLIVEYKGWRINPLICYDLRFPVWCRQPSGSPLFDLQIFIANWPERRSMPWKSLLTARAIENQCFVAAVNRIGSDGNDVPHSGDSQLLNFKGETLSSLSPNAEGTETLTLSLEELKEFREQFPAYRDADRYEIT